MAAPNNRIFYYFRELEWGKKYIPETKAPNDLLCEQETNPTDVTDPKPEFSAIHRTIPA